MTPSFIDRPLIIFFMLAPNQRCFSFLTSFSVSLLILKSLMSRSCAKSSLVAGLFKMLLFN